MRLRAAPPMLFALAAAYAHPMGNFSVSHYARFDVRPDGIELTYALDFAEIPTFELAQSWNLDGGNREAVIARAVEHAPGWISALRVAADGRPLTPRITRAGAVVRDGAGGLPVLRVTVSAMLPESRLIEYDDLNYSSRTGWKEIVIVPHDGVRLRNATHGAEDRSHALEAYPTDATVAPPQDTQAAFEWSRQSSLPHARAKTEPLPEGAVTPPQQQPTPLGTVVRGDFLSRMLHGGDITLGMMIAGICIAFGLGAMHALSPGHGKTIVAAYLVGSRGTIKHALFLGGMVTFTHTAAVFALGIGVLFFQRYIVPEKIIPVLSALSGVSIVLIGATLLYRRAKLLARHEHAHHDHPHHHHHHHPHEHSHAPQGKVALTGLVALGISGGLVPCPSALVLLLSATALGRVGLGMVLLVAFSAGLALVLMAIGATVLYARNLMPERVRMSAPALRYLPVLSAALVTAIGLVMTGVSLGLIQPNRFLQ